MLILWLFFTQKGVHGSETNGIMTQSQKFIKYDNQSFLFDEHLSKGEREFFPLTSTNKECPQTNFLQSNPDMMLKLFEMPSNMHNQSWRCFFFSIVFIWIMINSTQCLSCHLSSWINGNQTNTSKKHTNNTPSRRDQNKKRKKRNQTSHPKEKIEEQWS